MRGSVNAGTTAAAGSASLGTQSEAGGLGPSIRGATPAPAAPGPSLHPVHELMSESARRHAARPALAGAPGYHYDELDATTTCLAASLLAAGCERGDRVAIWMPKGEHYALSIYGAIKAGCAYVPIDANQPSARARAIAEDAAPTVLVTDSERLERGFEGRPPSSVKRILISDARSRGCHGRASIAPLAEALRPRNVSGLPRVGLDDLAALLYTSGSTGTPKGVQISHRNLANFVSWAISEMRFSSDDVFSNHASFNFDLSTFDLFVAGASAAAVWVIPDAAANNVAALAEGLRRHRVSVWYSVPSVLALLVSSGALSKAAASRLRYVLFAGEVYPIQRLRELYEAVHARTQLYNLYGPTETNVCTFHRVERIDPTRAVPVPIGRAIAGARLRVVDEQGEDVVGAGGIGELLVEGDCVTPGYWRRTGDRNTENHRRGVHATGDLVSFEGADLVYRGRRDRMIKLGGFRVELGEVEGALNQHPALREVAVVVGERSGVSGLVAFYALHDGAADPSLIELKSHCARRLPKYMIPRWARRLPALPKNANGKTDLPSLAVLARSDEEPAPIV